MTSNLKPLTSNLKMVFMGTPEIGVTVLSELIMSGPIVDSIITRPDKSKGRSGELVASPVKQFAIKNDIPVYQPVSKDELTKIIEKIKPDICIVAAYGMIIPNEALDVPKFGMINFHPSLLPKYRGPSPITEPILNGDKETGVTIIKVAEAMDAGDILAQKAIPLKGKKNTAELSGELAHLGAEMIVGLLPKIEAGTTAARKQDESRATYMKMVKKEDGKIDWQNMTAERIERMSRAYTPWPGVYTYWDGRKIDLFDIKIIKGKFEPGKVYGENKEIIIGTKQYGASPAYLKIEGKNKVSAEEFICGYSDFLGSKLT